MKKKILVIAPHQDDEIIGCGGTTAKMISEGHKVYVIYVLSGYSGVTDIKDNRKATRLREREAIQSCKSLGVSKYFFLREKDRQLFYNGETIKKIIKIIREIRPNIVFIPHENEEDFEHTVVSKMSQEAIWIANSKYFPEYGNAKSWIYDVILFYEVWTPIQRPNYFVDITTVRQKKTSALKKHKSQLTKVDYTSAVLGLNRYRGVMSFVGDFAEAFLIKRINKLNL